MAGRYDGSIRINTLIDTKNASAQLMSLENRISKTVDKMAALRTEMDALKDAEIPTQEYSEISKQIEKAETELNRLLGKQEQMQREGKNNGTAWETLNKKIYEAENTIKDAKGALQTLVDTGKAFTLGSDTQEYADRARQLRYLENDYDVLLQKQKEVYEANGDASSSFKKFDEAVSNTRNALRKVAGGFSGLNSSIKSTNSHVDRLNKSIKSVRNSISGLIRSLGAGLSIAGLAALGKEAMETASDIQEVQNVVDTAFGSMSYKMEEFADTAVKQFGMSRLSAKEMGSTFMAMGRSMVDSMETASDMAIALTARAADMASFYNKEAEETATALKSIYTGETETLKAYGVVMTEINLQEYAYQQGIKKKISAMSQAEKVQLRYMYVMEQTALASGDFAKTSDSWANQVRILKEQFKELLSVAGTGLITVFTPAVKFLNIILTQLIAIAKQTGAVLSKLTGISIPAADAGKFADSITDAAGGADELADSIEAAEKAANKALAPFDKLNVLSKDSGSSASGNSAGGISFEIPELELDETEAVDELGEKAEELMELLGHLFNPFKKSWESEGEFVISSWKYALAEISGLLGQIGTDFLRVWDSPETVVILTDILHIVGDIGLITGNLSKNFREAWAENDTGYEILCNIRDIIGVITANIKTAADYTVDWSDNLDFYPLLSKLEEWTESLIPVYNALSGTAADFYTTVLLPLGQWTLEKGLPELLQVFIDFNDEVDWEALRTDLKEFWEHLEPFAETVGEGLITFIDDVSDKLADFLNSDEFEDFLQDVEDWMDKVTPEDVANGLKGIAKALVTLKIALMGYGAVKTGLSTLQSLWTILKGLAASGRTMLAFLASLRTAWISLGGIGGILTTDVVTLIGAGTITEIGLAIGIALIAGIGAAKIGFYIGKEIGKALNPEDAEWYDNFTWFGEGGFFDTVTEDFETSLIALQQMATDFENNPAIAGLTDALIGPWASAALELPNKVEDIIGGFKDFTKAVESWWDTDMAGAFALWGKDISSWYEESVEPWFTAEKWQELGENVKEGVSSKWTEFTDWWTNTGLYNWWNDEVSPWFEKDKWNEFGANMEEGLSEKWKSFTDWWTNTGFYNWWNGTVVPCFKKDKWNFEGIKEGLSSSWNSAIEAIKKIWNDFTSWINEKLTWNIGPIEVGGKTVVEGTTINLGKLPMLADGAVIRGGNPFMAVLGDQPRGVTNIETPIPTMIKAFKQAMAESGGSAAGQYTFIAQLNGRTIFEETVKQDRMYRRATGHSKFEY